MFSVCPLSVVQCIHALTLLLSQLLASEPWILTMDLYGSIVQDLLTELPKILCEFNGRELSARPEGFSAIFQPDDHLLRHLSNPSSENPSVKEIGLTHDVYTDKKDERGDFDLTKLVQAIKTVLKIIPCRPFMAEVDKDIDNRTLHVLLSKAFQDPIVQRVLPCMMDYEAALEEAAKEKEAKKAEDAAKKAVIAANKEARRPRLKRNNGSDGKTVAAIRTPAADRDPVLAADPFHDTPSPVTVAQRRRMDSDASSESRQAPILTEETAHESHNEQESLDLLATYSPRPASPYRGEGDSPTRAPSPTFSMDVDQLDNQPTQLPSLPSSPAITTNQQPPSKRTRRTAHTTCTVEWNDAGQQRIVRDVYFGLCAQDGGEAWRETAALLAPAALTDGAPLVRNDDALSGFLQTPLPVPAFILDNCRWLFFPLHFDNGCGGLHDVHFMLAALANISQVVSSAPLHCDITTPLIPLAFADEQVKLASSMCAAV